MIERAAIDGSFADVLGDLGERGSAVLVCGAPPEETTARMCRRLFGQYGERPRDRLLVATEPTAAERLAPDAPGRAELVESVGFARSAAAVDSPIASAERTVVEADSLSALGVTVSDRVTALAADPAPEGVRVGVESLDPLFASHPPSAVFRFAHLLAGQVRSAGGMFHAHLGTERDHEHARLLTPVFDVVVELRRTHAGDQHRWHLPDRNRSTDWLAFDGETQTGD